MGEALIGVVIGGILTLLGGVLGAYIQYRLRKKERIYEQKVETYETFLRLMMQIISQKDLGNVANDLSDTSIKLQLYGTPEIINIFEHIMISLQPTDQQDEFLEIVKKTNADLDLVKLQKLIIKDLKRV